MAGSVGQTTIGILPWAGHKSSVGSTPVRANESTALGMGYLVVSQAQNDSVTWPVYLDSGTWKVCAIGRQASNQGISTVTFDGTTLGTMDWYNAASSYNNYKEITSISITTPKVADFTVAYSTKNASSTDYRGELQSIALIKTAGAHSTPSGTDTPGYTWMYLPWMGSKANANWDTCSQSSAQLGGGTLNVSSFATTNYVEWDAWLDAGTYKCAVIGETDTDKAILSLSLDGGSSTIGTVDFYAASNVLNVYKEATGLVVASAGVKTFRMTTATKNASSTNYGAKVNSVSWIRTGA